MVEPKEKEKKEQKKKHIFVVPTSKTNSVALQTIRYKCHR